MELENSLWYDLQRRVVWCCGIEGKLQIQSFQHQYECSACEWNDSIRCVLHSKQCKYGYSILQRSYAHGTYHNLLGNLLIWFLKLLIFLTFTPFVKGYNNFVIYLFVNRIFNFLQIDFHKVDLIFQRINWNSN